MPAPQPGGVVNLILLIICGAGGWFVGAWTKPAAPARAARIVETSAGLRNEPGVFATEARRLLALQSAGAGEFDNLVVRYGSGSVELRLLVPPLMERWAASDPAGAASAGLSRCLTHAPDAIPGALSSIAARESKASAGLIAAAPAGPLRLPCLAALAAGWGTAGRDDAVLLIESLPRHERTEFLREWHRARGVSDLPAAEKSAAGFKNPDDQAAARTGCLLARAAADPEITLREAASRDDFPHIAATAFRHWLPRDPTAAWSFAASLKIDPRLPDIAANMLLFEISRRRPSEMMPEIQSQINRLFPAGPPLEVLAAIIPVFAAEQTAVAQRFVELLPKSGTGGSIPLRECATVILFDTLCTTDPAAAWRLSESLVQAEGSKDNRATHRWPSAMARELATPPERIAAGFPDFTDMTNLALHWIESDTPAALATFCSPGVQAPLQRLAIETALSPHGTAIPLSQLIEWGQHQPAQLLHSIEAVGGK